MAKKKGVSVNAATTADAGVAAAEALDRASNGDGRDIERHLRGERLRQGWITGVLVRAKNGEEWTVAGAPMDPDQAIAFYEAVDRTEAATEMSNTRELMKAYFDVALYLIQQTYPALTREIANDMVIDSATAKRVLFAATNCVRPPEPREYEIEHMEKAVKHLMLNKSEHGGNAKKMAEMLVDWRPEQSDEEDDSKN